jgi:hypothetical protein
VGWVDVGGGWGVLLMNNFEVMIEKDVPLLKRKLQPIVRRFEYRQKRL